MKISEQYQLAADLFRAADAILVSAGAGMGVDSGLPDFRGNEGFWKAYPPIARLGLSFAEMANPHWFAVDSALAWAFYGHRLQLYRDTPPHAGYPLLLKLLQQYEKDYFVFTSNVDGHFSAAGYDQERIYEIHGSVHHFQCTTPCLAAIWPAGECRVEIDMEQFKAQEPLPRCPHCGQLARPNILMFSDYAWLELRAQEQRTRLEQWLVHLGEKRLLVMEFGAGLAVPTVRILSERISNGHDAQLLRYNPRDFSGPLNCIGLPVGSLQGITALDQYL